MDAIIASAYVAVTDFLQQGDIFRQDVVTPVVDTQKRIFRTEDGRHGSVVFSDGVNGKVFDEEDLKKQLDSCARTPLHTNPFEFTQDNHPELVVVHAHLTSYFVLATQTCDVSGVDKPAFPTAIILPVVTVRDVCRFQRLPFPSLDDQIMSIEDFFEANADAKNLRLESDPFHYPELIRTILAEWQPPTKRIEECRNRIRNFLSGMHKKDWMHFLQQGGEFQVPESYVDFSVAYTVPTRCLNDLKCSRIARIADPYRDQFAQAFAHTLARIAVPSPMKPKPF